MDVPADMAERRREILTELSEFGLALARDLHARALAADDAAACDLSLAFHRVSRSLRQTLALEARLERERRQGEREAAQDAARQTLARVQRRRAQVRAAIAPLIWDEAEGEEAESLLEELESRVFDACEDEAFVDAPIEACIERIRADLGLAAANAADSDGENPTVVIWRSSA